MIAALDLIPHDRKHVPFSALRSGISYSHVAGILDRKGGLRVVVTANQLDFARHHQKRGERIFILPDFLVPEPVPWEKVPGLINSVFLHVNKQLAPVNDCGTCMACCRTLYIEEGAFIKRSHVPCPNCRDDYGCKIYAARPQVCRTFRCEWLRSQGTNDPMAPELRPDRCHVIFTLDTDYPDDWSLFECHIDNRHKDAAYVGVARDWIDQQQALGRKAKLITGYRGEVPR